MCLRQRRDYFILSCDKQYSIFKFPFTPRATTLFILKPSFVWQASHLFLATVIQLVVCGQLPVHQLCKEFGILHVAVSSYDINVVSVSQVNTEVKVNPVFIKHKTVFSVNSSCTLLFTYLYTLTFIRLKRISAAVSE